MDCPYCKKEMAQGAILNDHHIWWYPKEVTGIPLIRGGEDGAVRLSGGGGVIIDGARAESWYCAACRTVITPVPEIEEPLSKLKEKWNAIADRIGEETEKRRAEREEEQLRKKNEARRKKDPWEV